MNEIPDKNYEAFRKIFDIMYYCLLIIIIIHKNYPFFLKNTIMFIYKLKTFFLVQA